MINVVDGLPDKICAVKSDFLMWVFYMKNKLLMETIIIKKIPDEKFSNDMVTQAIMSVFYLQRKFFSKHQQNILIGFSNFLMVSFFSQFNFNFFITIMSVF